MNAVTTLEWDYTPIDFFETPFQYQGDQCIVTINEGKVRAELGLHGEHDFKRINEDVNGLFLGAQLIDHRSYVLSGYAVVQTLPDGSRIVGVTAHMSGRATVSGRMDCVVTDAAGNIKHDSRKERIRTRERLAALAVRHRDDAFGNALLATYRSAVNEPEIELVRLYEIREAIAGRFGGEGPARRALGISSKQWSRLGALANDQSINQGRHRGQNLSGLRDATGAELEEARTIAEAMIRAYLEGL